MKKILSGLVIGLGTTSPLVTVVACSQATNENDQVTGEFSEYLQIDGQDFIPEDDGMYLMAEYYDGHMFHFNEETRKNELYDGEILEIYQSFQYWDQGDNFFESFYPYTEFGKYDSFVVVYNEDIEDGYTVSNFEDTFAFQLYLLDANSDFATQALTTHNVDRYNNKEGWVTSSSTESRSLFVGWEDGKLNKFVGVSVADYNNDVFSSLPAVKEAHDKEDYEAILEALFLEELEDGVYTDSVSYDPSLDSHQRVRANPIIDVPSYPLFTYEQIAKNAIKITNVVRNDEFPLHYKSFGFLEQVDDEIDGSERFIMEDKGQFQNDEYAWGDWHVRDDEYGYMGIKIYFDD